MPSIHQGYAAPDVTPCTRRLTTGQYVGYIEHRTGGSAATQTESFVAGVFDDDAAARAAALRLLQTFQSSVIAPGHETPDAPHRP